MEEKKQAQNEQNAQKKYSYEELNHIAGDLLRQRNELMSRVESMQEALDNRDFQYTAYYIDSLFKVMEHPEMYKTEFVDKASGILESMLTKLGNSLNPENGTKNSTDSEAE